MNILTWFIKNESFQNYFNKKYTGSKIKTKQFIHTINFFSQQKKIWFCESFISHQLFDKNSINNVKIYFLKKNQLLIVVFCVHNNDIILIQVE